MAKEHLLQHGTRVTPQSEAMRDDQVPNSAGGFAWEISDWDKLRRFLILGTEGGSYYADERKLTTKNIDALKSCLNEDGPRAVGEIAAISQGGRAPKNDQALFALAYAISHGDKETRRAAAEALPDVARIGTHLYHFVTYAEGMRGWGRTMRWAVSNWYNRKPEQLAYQAIKYRQRDGWDKRDPLRLAHPTPRAENRDTFGFLSGNVDHTSQINAELNRIERKVNPWKAGENTLPIIEGFLKAQKAETPKQTAALIREYNLPREALKTEHLNSVEVWGALLESGMPMTAMIRNLATMTRNGTLDDTVLLNRVVDQLGQEEFILKSRVHPLTVLIALRTYAAGHSFRGRGENWVPKPSIVDALDEAFYLAFGNVESTGKRFLLALDVSGSMDSGSVAGSYLTPREASGAMAMVTVATEPNVEVVAFADARYQRGAGGWHSPHKGRFASFHGIQDGLWPVALSKRRRLDDVVNELRNFHMGGTDCSLPFLYAKDKSKQFDAFIVYTDSETWAGEIHPKQALDQYRQQSGINARSVVVGMVSNGFSIADPQDAGMLDVVGMDTATPNLISEFVSGTI